MHKNDVPFLQALLARDDIDMRDDIGIEISKNVFHMAMTSQLSAQTGELVIYILAKGGADIQLLNKKYKYSLRK